jgi:hypothetical protein
MNPARSSSTVALGALLLAGCPPVAPDVTLPGGEVLSSLSETAFPGIVGVPNLDDDNRNGTPDWRDFDISEDDDLATFTIPAEVLGAIRNNRPLRLTMRSGDGEVRVWQDGELVLGENDGDDAPRALEFERGDEALRFGLEFRDFLAEAEFELAFLKNGEPQDGVRWKALAAPLVMNQHLQPAEQVMAVEVDFGSYDNADLIAGYQEALGDDFLTVRGPDYQGDVWIQDEIEFATVSSAESRIDFVIDSIRDRGLDDVAEDLFEGPEFIVRTWGDGWATSQDSFGNLEATPPVTVDGVHYPFGKVYYGDAGGGAQVVRALQDMFDEQTVQAPFELDTSWLCVGHVDEFMSWIPDPSAPRGWRLVYTDIEGAWDVLEGMDPTTRLPLYEDGHGFDTVGEIVDDNGLRALNQDLWDDYLEPNLEILRRELDLQDEEILWLPGLFEVTSQCGGATAALIPGMANLIVANFPDEPVRLFMADPFLRTDLGDQGEDPMIDRVRSLFPAEQEVYFLDDFWVYHMGLGEVHCGSNVIRTPVEAWWSSIKPLIEEN